MAARVEVSGLWFDSLSEVGVLEAVRRAWAADIGGSIIPVNVNVALAASKDAALARIFRGMST